MNKTKILLVDDEENFVETLSERFSLKGFESQFVLNGKQALNLIHGGFLPDVVILDLKMPEIDGLETLRRIKKDYPSVQVIMLTGHGSHEDEVISRKMGAFDFFLKPVKFEKLLQKVENACLVSNRNLKCFNC